LRWLDSATKKENAGGTSGAGNVEAARKAGLAIEQSVAKVKKPNHLSA
jgi:hypothetical protein